MTKDQKQKIAELRTAGFGYANIANALGLTKESGRIVLPQKRSPVKNRHQPDKAGHRPGCCKNCGKPITQVPGRKTIKFCSDECCQSWWNTHPEAVTRRSAAIYSFTCAYCGQPFTAYGNRHRKYCSHACYIADRFGGAAMNEEQFEREKLYQASMNMFQAMLKDGLITEEQYAIIDTKMRKNTAR
jgi:endogenous inhibitor of DNA gyrase (YacG/DUF329 family)